MGSYTDVTDATFETDVLAVSDATPVVVDLWAPWCGPCRTLGPILEKVVEETAGEVVLVKVNTDENPALTDAFKVQGIPAVHAVVNRRVVASFVGAQPESAVREFVEKLRPTEESKRLAALIETGTEESLLEALEQDPANPQAIVALAEVYVGEGRNDEALAMLDKVPESAETRRVAALARTGLGTVEDGTVAVDGDAGLEGVETKLDELLTRVKGDDDARQEFLDLLELMGPQDPRTVEYRRALSRQLF